MLGNQSGSSVFIPASAAKLARTRSEPWAVYARESSIALADPWKAASFETLWNHMFAPTITRAWQVWSSGHCPVCKGELPEYSWEMDALARPWKTRCPHCTELFPKNDFAAYYRSGLDEHAEFDPSQADRTLLFNTNHPDPADPMHLFGVDDGGGYQDGELDWRFIGAYLIYGQWKQLIVGGVRALASAYVLTGDPDYAARAGILLHRVADIYPRMDFHTQGWLYEKQARTGFVSTWHDACWEIIDMARAYDAIRPGLETADSAAEFLYRQAGRYTLPDAPQSGREIQDHIEKDLLQITIDGQDRIRSNFPTTECAVITLHAVVDATGRKEQIGELLDQMITQATAVDGVTGEKGLSAYSALTMRTLYQLLSDFLLVDAEQFSRIIRRHPRLQEGVRFFIDTWCLQKFYPSCGDAGVFTRQVPNFAPLSFESYVEPGKSELIGKSGVSSIPRASAFHFLWEMYRLNGDEELLQLMHCANDHPEGKIGFGLLAETGAEVKQAVDRVVAERGASLRGKCGDKTEWHLSVLHSGEDENERALWLDYDVGGSHRHSDGMNLGLYAFGLDLLPDFGYPPTGFGGHLTLQALWYTHTAAHNSVIIDDKCQPGPRGSNSNLAAGETTLWIEESWVKGFRNNAPDMYEEATQYERTTWMVDVSSNAFYILDIFRVCGGNAHTRLWHSGFANLTITGAQPTSVPEFVEGDAILRSTKIDSQPAFGWQADFAVEDRYGYAPEGSDIHLRVTDLTRHGQAGSMESWINDGTFNEARATWIPTVFTRTHSQEEALKTTFVSLLEPFDTVSRVDNIRRVDVLLEDGTGTGDAYVAVEVTLADGRTDRHLATNTGPAHGKAPGWQKGSKFTVPAWRLSTDCEALILRATASRTPEMVARGGTFVELAGIHTDLPNENSR